MALVGEMRSIKTCNPRGVSRGCKGSDKGKQKEAFLCLFFILSFQEEESSRNMRVQGR